MPLNTMSPSKDSDAQTKQNKKEHSASENKSAKDKQGGRRRSFTKTLVEVAQLKIISDERMKEHSEYKKVVANHPEEKNSNN